MRKEAKPRGRPIAPPRESREQTIDALRGALDKQPASVPVWVGRAALHHLEAAREQQIEVWRLEQIAQNYASLVGDWNTICEAVRQAGIEVFMAMGETWWTWTRGDARGTADTVGAAIVAALHAKEKEGE